MKRLAIAALALLSAATATAQGGPAFQIAETGKGYATLQQAVEAIGEGEGTIIISPGTYRECAVQTTGDISYRAAVPGKTIFERKLCENKAAIVLRGYSASIDGIIFRNMQSSDSNGAGLRLEQGSLKVTRAVFRDSQQGILTAHDPRSTLTVDQSTFSGLGICTDHCAHSIYGGHIAKLTVTNSRFEKGTGGHYIKFRGREVSITNNAFDDSEGQGTNYMIDLPNGSTGMIANNMFVQGMNKENATTFIAVSAEEKKQTSNGLTIRNNDASLATGVDRTTTFVVDWSGDNVSLGANRLGNGIRIFERR